MTAPTPWPDELPKGGEATVYTVVVEGEGAGAITLQLMHDDTVLQVGESANVPDGPWTRTLTATLVSNDECEVAGDAASSDEGEPGAGDPAEVYARIVDNNGDMYAGAKSSTHYLEVVQLTVDVELTGPLVLSKDGTKATYTMTLTGFGMGAFEICLRDCDQAWGTCANDPYDSDQLTKRTKHFVSRTDIDPVTKAWLQPVVVKHQLWCNQDCEVRGDFGSSGEGALGDPAEVFAHVTDVQCDDGDTLAVSDQLDVICGSLCKVAYCQGPDQLGELSIGSCALGSGSNQVTVTHAGSTLFAMLLVSDAQGFVSHPPGAVGDLCLAGAIGRYSADLQAPFGTGTYSVDVFDGNTGGGAGWLPSPPGGQLQPGDTWNFQAWNRLPDGAPSRFTEALSVTFQ